MNRAKLRSLRECQGRGELFNAMAEDMSLAGELLDTAEVAVCLRESIAITDRNTRTMMAELHELRAWKVEAEAVHEETRGKLDEAINFLEADGVKCRTYSKTSCRSEHGDDLCRSCKRLALIERIK